jgi:hypothetical protein
MLYSCYFHFLSFIHYNWDLPCLLIGIFLAEVTVDLSIGKLQLASSIMLIWVPSVMILLLSLTIFPSVLFQAWIPFSSCSTGLLLSLGSCPALLILPSLLCMHWNHPFLWVPLMSRAVLWLSDLCIRNSLLGISTQLFLMHLRLYCTQPVPSQILPFQSSSLYLGMTLPCTTLLNQKSGQPCRLLHSHLDLIS